MIFYESPFRLLKTLEQLAVVMGNERYACVSRELTKIYEENARGTLEELIQHFSNNKIRGEIVIVLAGAGVGTGAGASPGDGDETGAGT
jgi:16S rRNA (cytidine1402-2'-O)-methyltransferase